MASNMDYVKGQMGKLTPSKAGMAKLGFNYLTSPRHRIGIEAGIGMATGIGASMLDKEEDTLGSSLTKGVVAAGAGYAVTEGLVIAGGKYARTEHFAKKATGLAVDNIEALKGLKNHEEKAAKVVHGAAQRMLPNMNGKLGIGAAGMAAGLLFTMANGQKDGAAETSTNMVAGAGLAFMGGELFKSFDKSKKTNFSGLKDVYDKAGERVLNSETGQLFKSTMNDLLESDDGKKFKSEISKVFGTEDGKTVANAYKEVKTKGLKTPLSTIEGAGPSVGRVEQDLKKLLQSDEGKRLLTGLGSQVGDLNELQNKFAHTLQNDLTKELTAQAKLFQSGLSEVDSLYKAHPEAIDNFISANFPAKGNEMKEFLKTGLPKAIQELDTVTAQEITDQAKKKGNEAPKREKVRDAKAEAAKVVRTDNRLTVSRIQARDIQEMYKQPGTPASYNTKKYEEAQQKAHATKQKMHRVWGGAKVAGVAGLGAFALASVMDTSESLSEDKHTSRMVKQQEERLTKKQTKERREQNKQGYGNIDMGQMAIDLFNERTGHHKMGNAKFQ